jgi:hypothetical protein
MPIDDLEALEHKLTKRGFKVADALLHDCTACGERAVRQYRIAGRIGGRDIWLCLACGVARSWTSGAGMEDRSEDAGFDLRAFLK